MYSQASWSTSGARLTATRVVGRSRVLPPTALRQPSGQPCGRRARASERATQNILNRDAGSRGGRRRDLRQAESPRCRRRTARSQLASWTAGPAVRWSWSRSARRISRRQSRSSVTSAHGRQIESRLTPPSTPNGRYAPETAPGCEQSTRVPPCTKRCTRPLVRPPIARASSPSPRAPGSVCSLGPACTPPDQPDVESTASGTSNMAARTAMSVLSSTAGWEELVETERVCRPRSSARVLMPRLASRSGANARLPSSPVDHPGPWISDLAVPGGWKTQVGRLEAMARALRESRFGDAEPEYEHGERDEARSHDVRCSRARRRPRDAAAVIDASPYSTPHAACRISASPQSMQR